MYKILVRPLLFLFTPESIHHIVGKILKISFIIPGVSYLINRLYFAKNIALERNVAGLKFKNPVGLAAGFDKNALLYNELSNLGFSFVEIGTVTPEPQPGNKMPRSFRLEKDKALINRMGFNNDGVEAVVNRLKRRKCNIIIGGNIGKNTLTPNGDAYNDYEICFRKIYDYVDYIAVNVSCPNINNLTELQDAKALENILHGLMEIRKKQAKHKPVFLKVSPDLDNTQLDEVIEICRNKGVNGIIATNTTIAREELRSSKDKICKIGKGGLSGRPITKRSTAVIKYLSKKLEGKLPIIGVGGIMSSEDALEKIEAGATLVQVYTGFIYEGPCLAKRINKAILKKSNK